MGISKGSTLTFLSFSFKEFHTEEYFTICIFLMDLICCEDDVVVTNSWFTLSNRFDPQVENSTILLCMVLITNTHVIKYVHT